MQELELATCKVRADAKASSTSLNSRARREAREGDVIGNWPRRISNAERKKRIREISKTIKLHTQLSTPSPNNTLNLL